MKTLILALIFLSCQPKDHSPENALKHFIEARMERIISKDEVLSLVTGKFKQAIEALNDEEFSQFADLKSVKKDGFKILSKTCQGKTCYVTYVLTYKKLTNDKASAISENKKIAELVFEEGKWLIAEVSNLKTYVESLAPIEPLNP
jgi:hypothetical protein